MAQAECCFNCIYSFWDRAQMFWNLAHRVITRPTCGNQPDFPGQVRSCPRGPVCRNYRPRPPKPEGETVKTIPVGDGLTAYVDAADFEWLNQWTWTLHSGYAVRYHNRKQIYMHREIAKPPQGMIVDHKNRNKLDDTRDNLRISTHSENAGNRGKPRGSASRFLGVGYDRHRRKWYANLGVDGKAMWLGYFKDEVEAARGYDHAAVEQFGESANLNFFREWPPERIREVHEKRTATKEAEGT